MASMIQENEFNAKAYLLKYPDVNLSNMSPYDHYVKYGHMMGRNLDTDLNNSKKSNSEFQDNRRCYKDYISISDKRKSGLALDATILRTRSLGARDLILWCATKGNTDANQMYSLLEQCRIPQRKKVAYELLDDCDIIYLFKFAKLIALQSVFSTDRLNAFTIYKYGFERSLNRFFGAEHGKIFFDLAYEARDFYLANEIVNSKDIKIKSDPVFYSKVDLMNPFLNKNNDYEQWISRNCFNRIFDYYDLEHVDVTDSNLLPFDRLSSLAITKIADGPLVTVVISVWNPDQSLITSVISIINQSWQNLEIMLIDDACEEIYHEVINKACSLDSRIRLIRQSENQGTYMARNTAIKEARGEFITFQDADDWSHPRRIEFQVLQLINNESLVATTSKTVRVTDYLSFSYLGYSDPKRLNTSSLMYRLKVVTKKIGFFDCSRKGADSEFLKRITITFGDSSYTELKEVLSIVRLSIGSLSRAEFAPGWHHPARMIYKGAYTHWHNKIKAGLVSPYLSGAVEERKFPIPERFKIQKSEVEIKAHYDVLIVGDWRKTGGPQNSMVNEIYALKNAGYKVAVMHLEAYRFMTTDMQNLNSEIQEMINSEIVSCISFLDEADIDKVILRYPPILQFLPAGVARFNTKELFIVANQAPFELDGSDVRYEVGVCINNAFNFFKVEGIWIPQGPLVRDILTDLVPSRLMSNFDLLGIINCDEWVCKRAKLSEKFPVIGRYSRDDVMKFPNTVDELFRCYPPTGEFSVKIMGGKKSCAKLMGGENYPSCWQMFDHNEVETKEFLESIDFFVHFDNDNIVEAFGRSILEALASGTIAILPQKFEKVFGDAAIYCTPGEVSEKVRYLSSNPEVYLQKSSHAISVVRRMFSEQAYLEKIFPS